MENDNQLIPAVITAIAGIAGIVINIIVNTFYKHFDNREELKNKSIIAYELYYAPLCSKFNDLVSSYQQLTVSDSQLDLKKIAEYLLNDSAPAMLSVKLDDFYSIIEDTHDFILNNEYKCLNDYKTNYLYHCSVLLIKDLYNTKKKIEDSGTNIDIKIIIDFIKRVDQISIKLFSRNFLHNLYLRYWNYKTKKRG